MSGRPLNGKVLPFEKCGFGRKLQQAAKSFLAERTYFDNHPYLHPHGGRFRVARQEWNGILRYLRIETIAVTT
jgi:hypothetical protein